MIVMNITTGHSDLKMIGTQRNGSALPPNIGPAGAHEEGLLGGRGFDPQADATWGQY